MDSRPPFESVLGAFGLDAVVTLPDGTETETEAVWLPPVSVDVPSGSDMRRAEARHVLALPLSGVPEIPRGTVITVASQEGGDATDWAIDSFDRVDSDHYRCVVRPNS